MLLRATSLLKHGVYGSFIVLERQPHFLSSLILTRDFSLVLSLTLEVLGDNGWSTLLFQKTDCSSSRNASFILKDKNIKISVMS